jgi:hypothetical protein
MRGFFKFSGRVYLREFVLRAARVYLREFINVCVRACDSVLRA